MAAKMQAVQPQRVRWQRALKTKMAAHGQYEYDVMNGCDNVDDCGKELVGDFGSDNVGDSREEHVGAFCSDNESLHHDGNKDQLQR